MADVDFFSVAREEGPSLPIDPVSILVEVLAGYLFTQIADHGLLAPVRRWRRKKALDRALRAAIRDFSLRHPGLYASFFDERFIETAAAPELRLLFTRDARPSPEQLAVAFKRQFKSLHIDVTAAASDFLELVEQRTNKEPLLHDLLQSRESYETLRLTRDVDKKVTALADTRPPSKSGSASLAAASAAASREIRSLLGNLVLRRFFGDTAVNGEITSLVKRLDTDLEFINDDIKIEILHTAALWECASPDGVPTASAYREQIRRIRPSADVRRIEAAILVARGDVQTALRILRDIDEPGARRHILHVHLHDRRADLASQWLDSLDLARGDLFDEIGWAVAGLAYLAAGRWDDGLKVVRQALSASFSPSPLLLYLEGVLEFKLSLPEAIRSTAPEQLTLPERSFLPQDDKAHERRKRSVDALRRCREDLARLSVPRETIVEIDKQVLLVLLSDDRLEQEGRAVLPKMLADDPLDPLLLRLAVRLRLEVDLRGIRDRLRAQEITGGLDERGLNAMLLILEHEGDWPGVRDFLVRERPRLTETTLGDGQWAARLINAHMRLQDYSAASEILEAEKGSLGEDYARFAAMISHAKGEDQVDSLRAQYNTTGALVDLANLVNVLHEKRRYGVLREYAIALADQLPNVTHLLIVAECLNQLGDDQALLTVLERHRDLVLSDVGLRLYYAHSLLYQARFADAESQANGLANQSPEQAAALLARVHLCSGNWDKIIPLAHAELRAAPARSAIHLLRLAHLVSILDRNVAQDLLRSAVARAPNDAAVLSGAGFLAFRLGHDDEGSEWIAQGASLSGEEGPITKVTLEELAATIPKAAERRETVNELLRKGQLPLHLFCQERKTGLSAMLIATALDNMDDPDPARQPLIPIRHESRAYRPITGIAGVKAVAVDLSGLFLAELLGIWDVAKKRFDKIFVVWDIMAVLHKEIEQAEFHQPSRVLLADELHEMVSGGRVLIAPREITPPSWLVEEVGVERASLLEAARVSGGIVVDDEPIDRAGSLGSAAANLRDYADLVRTPAELLAALEARASLNTDELNKARTALGRRASVEGRSPRPMGGRSLFIDSTVLPTLAEAGLLGASIRLWQLHVSHETYTEYESLRTAAKQAGRVIALLTSLRRRLVDGISEGRVVVLPMPRTLKDRDRDLYGLTSLIFGPGPVDAVWIDDRMASSTPGVTDHQGRTYPWVGVVEVLEEYVRAGLMDQARLRAAYRTLRRANFGLLSLDVSEVRDELAGAQVQGGSITETKDLAELRRYVLALLGGRYLTEAALGSYVLPLSIAVVGLIVWCWSDPDVPSDVCEARANWVLDNLFVAPGYMDHLFPSEVRADVTAEFLATLSTGHTGVYGTPFVAVAQAHLQRYRTWLEERIIGPFRIANDSLVVDAANRLRDFLRELLDERSE